MELDVKIEDARAKQHVKRTLIIDSATLRSCQRTQEAWEHSIEEAEKRGEIEPGWRVVRCMPMAMFSEAQHQVEQLGGDTLGNIADKGHQHEPMEEFFNSRTGTDFMDV